MLEEVAGEMMHKMSQNAQKCEMMHKIHENVK